MKKFFFLTAVFLMSAASEAFQIEHSGRIIPVPKQASYGDYIAINEAGSPLFCIVKGEDASDLDVISAGIITERALALSGDLGFSLPVLNPEQWKSSADEYEGAIFIGSRRTSSLSAGLAREHRVVYPRSGEGYIIREFERDGKRIILASGTSCRGTYYAAQSLAQLMKREEGSVLLRSADVNDYPSYRMRISGNDESVPAEEVSLEAVRWLSMFKLNGWAAGQSYLWPDDWRRMPEDRLAGLKAAAGLAAAGMIDIMYQLHPFGKLQDRTGRHSINMYMESELAKLSGMIRNMLDAGASSILLRADDFHELHPAAKAIHESKAIAHSYLINRIHREMRRTHPDALIYFCPPYYTGEEVAKSDEKSDYFRTLRDSIPEDIVIVWTGHEVCSFNITSGHVRDFSSTAGRRLMLWDNTVFRCRSSFGYPYEYAYYLFNPIETVYPEGLSRDIAGIRYNYGYDGTEISKIANITLADYLWNPEAHNPQASLESAIALVAGEDAVRPILKFARQMQNAYDLYHSPARIFALDEPAPAEDFLKLLEEIRELTSNAKLVEELSERFIAQKDNIITTRAFYGEAAMAADEALAVIDLSSARIRIRTDGAWKAERKGGVLEFSFPFQTPASAGLAGSAEIRRLRLPRSRTGKYYLVFLSDDDYNLSGTEALWEDFIYKQALVNNEVVWESDVAEPNLMSLHVADITDFVDGSGRISLAFRGYIRNNVYNLGARITFSSAFITDAEPGEF